MVLGRGKVTADSSEMLGWMLVFFSFYFFLFKRGLDLPSLLSVKALPGLLER